MEFIEYITKEGDRWDNIAFAAFGKASRVDLLIDSNPQIPSDAALPGGLKMIVPVIERERAEVEAALLPPWKR